MRAGVKEVFALEENFRAAQFLSEALCEIKIGAIRFAKQLVEFKLLSKKEKDFLGISWEEKILLEDFTMLFSN